ncbi:hypothetical protein ACHQM5_019058 [Ranunculus cassubicifolius]
MSVAQKNRKQFFSSFFSISLPLLSISSPLTTARRSPLLVIDLAATISKSVAAQHHHLHQCLCKHLFVDPLQPRA